MTRIGYALSSEEHSPSDLVRNARLAEEAGFDFAMISDHYHPWIDRQGHSPFVWSVIGGIAATTERITIGTGVTCPLIRIHPAIIAQAAATSAAMLPGRFVLGVGTGENLNEHVLGDKWPPVSTRQEMLEEAVDILRQLWTGEQVFHEGLHYVVENARIYDRPKAPPPIAVAAAGPESAAVAGRIGDALVGTAPDASVVQAFEENGGRGKPRYGQVTLCWASNDADARRTTTEIWPTSAVPGQLSQELPLPLHYEQALKTVREEDILEHITTGPDPKRHLEAIGAYVDAGFDHVYLHQIGPDQAGFLDFATRELLPALRGTPTPAGR